MSTERNIYIVTTALEHLEISGSRNDIEQARYKILSSGHQHTLLGSSKLPARTALPCHMSLLGQ
jgi:hypothetical protein